MPFYARSINYISFSDFNLKHFFKRIETVNKFEDNDYKNKTVCNGKKKMFTYVKVEKN